MTYGNLGHFAGRTRRSCDRSTRDCTRYVHSSKGEGELRGDLGVGRLMWSTPQDEIDHPLVTVPVEIHLNNTADGVLSEDPTAAVTIEVGFLSEVELADRGTFFSLREQGRPRIWTFGQIPARSCSSDSSRLFRPRWRQPRPSLDQCVGFSVDVHTC